jgi:hypothetical protein
LIFATARSTPARLRSLRQAEAQQAAAREAWLAEKESLQAGAGRKVKVKY